MGNVIFNPTAHRIAFCTPGYTADDYLNGCALSCPIEVVSSLAFIEWSVQPSLIRSTRRQHHSRTVCCGMVQTSMRMS